MMETTGFRGTLMRRLMVEDCQTLEVRALIVGVVVNRFELVRKAREWVDDVLAA